MLLKEIKKDFLKKQEKNKSSYKNKEKSSQSKNGYNVFDFGELLNKISK